MQDALVSVNFKYVQPQVFTSLYTNIKFQFYRLRQMNRFSAVNVQR